MGWGGAKFRTWSGPGGSSHKGPLTSAPAYSRCFDVAARRARALPSRYVHTRKAHMDIIDFFVNLLSDPRGAIAGWIATLGAGAYLPIFLIVFVETGVVIMPFLPGDSLLFTAGIFAADDGGLTLTALLPVVWAAAILGDTCNYWIGREFGKRIIDSGKVKAMTPERIEKTEGLINKYGPLAIFLGRFFPFIRTFVPFFAGFGHMHYRKFLAFNVLGALVWSTVFILLGYFFGGIPFVQEHFEFVIVGIVVISLIPAIAGAVKAKMGMVRTKRAGESGDVE